eukprot:2074140-Amphidinium_carterae.1
MTLVRSARVRACVRAWVRGCVGAWVSGCACARVRGVDANQLKCYHENTELDTSPNANKAFEITKLAEQTKQKELQADIERQHAARTQMQMQRIC